MNSKSYAHVKYISRKTIKLYIKTLKMVTSDLGEKIG